MRSIAINVEKGGVGKTTISAHLAWHFADKDLRVLAIDMDRQSNLRCALGSDFSEIGHVSELLAGEIDVTALPRLALLHSDDGVSEMLGPEANAYIQTFVDELAKLDEFFDVCVIDNPPNWGWINMASMLAADGLLVPIEPALFSMKGAEQVGKTVSAANDYRDTPIHVVGMLANRVLATRSHRDRLDDVRAAVGPVLLDATVHNLTDIEVAMDDQQPVWRRKGVRSGAIDDMCAAMNEIETRMEAADGT